MARAGGVFPLFLWWAFSVARGVLPVVMSWLVSRCVCVCVLREATERVGVGEGAGRLYVLAFNVVPPCCC